VEAAEHAGHREADPSPGALCRAHHADARVRRDRGGHDDLHLARGAARRLVEPETFTGYGKAWWWAVQTVSTVGYGDITPHTTAGRLVATAVMIFGVALVPTATSIVVAILLDRHRRD
jgi:voltage-gated potassium channel Kch